MAEPSTTMVSERVGMAVDEGADGVKHDLMTIPMRVRGFSIIDSLKGLG